MLHCSNVTDILFHLTTEGYSHRLDTSADAKHRYLTVIGQLRNQQFCLIALSVNAMKQRRWLFTSPKRINVAATTENHGIDTVKRINDDLSVSYWWYDNGHTTCLHDRLIIAAT